MPLAPRASLRKPLKPPMCTVLCLLPETCRGQVFASHWAFGTGPRQRETRGLRGHWAGDRSQGPACREICVTQHRVKRALLGRQETHGWCRGQLLVWVRPAPSSLQHASLWPNIPCREIPRSKASLGIPGTLILAASSDHRWGRDGAWDEGPQGMRVLEAGRQIWVGAGVPYGPCTPAPARAQTRAGTSTVLRANLHPEPHPSDVGAKDSCAQACRPPLSTALPQTRPKCHRKPGQTISCQTRVSASAWQRLWTLETPATEHSSGQGACQSAVLPQCTRF